MVEHPRYRHDDKQLEGDQESDREEGLDQHKGQRVDEIQSEVASHKSEVRRRFCWT